MQCTVCPLATAKLSPEAVTPHASPALGTPSFGSLLWKFRVLWMPGVLRAPFFVVQPENHYQAEEKSDCKRKWPVYV